MRKGFVLVVVMLVMTGSAFAQVGLGTPVFCGDLSDADCAIVTNAQIPESAAFSGDANLSFDVEGFPVEVGLGLSGSYIADVDFYSDLQEQMIEGDIATFYADIYGDTDNFLTFLTDYFRSVDSDMTLTVTVPEDLTGGMVPTPLPVDLWLVEGVAYADIGAFSFVDPSLTGVYGFDLPGFYTELFTDEELTPFMDEMFAAQGEGMMSMFADMSFVEEFSTITRLPDAASADGQTLATFETTFDYGAFFASDAMRELMQAQIDAQMELLGEELDSEDVSEEEMEAIFDGVLDAYAVAFEGSEASIVQMIGVDDGYIHEVQLDFFMDVDLEAVIAAMEAALPEDEALDDDLGMGEMPPFIIDFEMSITQNGFGTVTDVALPEGAEVLPLDSFGM